jgi:hypothetical protein
MRDSFRLSLNGGHVIGSGNLYTIALNIVAQRKPGLVLYVRCLDDMSVVAEIRDTATTYTRHGVPIDITDPLPDWAPKLQQLIKGNT